jgi:hypothetical protein
MSDKDSRLHQTGGLGTQSTDEGRSRRYSERDRGFCSPLAYASLVLSRLVTWLGSEFIDPSCLSASASVNGKSDGEQQLLGVSMVAVRLGVNGIATEGVRGLW